MHVTVWIMIAFMLKCLHLHFEWFFFFWLENDESNAFYRFYLSWYNPRHSQCPYKSKVKGKVFFSRPTRCVCNYQSNGKKIHNPGAPALMLVRRNETLNFYISPCSLDALPLGSTFSFMEIFNFDPLWVDHSLYSWSQAAINFFFLFFIVEVHCYISFRPLLNV